MSELNQENYQNMNDLDRARKLRMEAEMLEHKQRVRGRLRQLIAVSQDTEYDKYLAQLLKDLESGKATPMQVERETERSYNMYRQRLAKGMIQRPQPIKSETVISQPIKNELINNEPVKSESVKQQKAEQQITKRPPKVQKDYEFKVGAHVFSLVGAVFVLAAFIIFGFNFLTGILQGLCLYIAALALVLLSELLLRRKSVAFSNVITGIGIGGLYVANIINYLVLHTINGLIAMVITLVIAIGTIWISRKKNSTSIRIISLLGCYICFFPVDGFETALSFLVVAVMLLVINVVSIFFQNQSNQVGINIFHVALNVVFTAIITGIAWAADIEAIYLIIYVITSFIFINVLCLKCCRQTKNVLFPITCVGNGICLFLIYLIGSLASDLDGSDFKRLYVHLIAEVLVLAISIVAFLLWEREDQRKWSHVYYAALLIIGLKSTYNLDVIVSTITVFLVIKILSKNKSLQILDCIVTAWTCLIGLSFVPFLEWEWEAIDVNPILNGRICLSAFIVAVLVSVVFIRANYMYHEFIITGFMVLAIRQILVNWDLETGWFLLAEAIALFGFFLIFNHLPALKGKEQFPYNIVSVCLMALFYIASSFENWMFSTAMMILGAVVIVVVFRRRYQLAIPRKYLLLAGFLAFFALAGDYGSPVVESILLMIIALSCVGIGFKQKDKAERICGLVMAVFVCMKLVLYDFREVETMYRVIVFLVVGVLALGISFIYILLEKNEDKQEKQLLTEENTNVNHLNA